MNVHMYFLTHGEIFIFTLPHPTYAPQSQLLTFLCSWGRPWSSQIWRLYFHSITSAFVYILNLYYICIVCVLMHVHILVWMIRKTTCRDQLFPFSTGIAGIKLRSSGWQYDPFPNWVVFLAPDFCFSLNVPNVLSVFYLDSHLKMEFKR